MSVPQRIQLRRSRGWRKPDGAIVVARPSRWGNPYKVGQWVIDPVTSRNPIASVVANPGVGLPSHFTPGTFDEPWPHRVYRINTPQQAVDLFRRWWVFEGHDASPLRGRDLACWCPLEDDRGRRVPCHADVLLELANRDDDQ